MEASCCCPAAYSQNSLQILDHLRTFKRLRRSSYERIDSPVLRKRQQLMISRRFRSEGLFIAAAGGSAEKIEMNVERKEGAADKLVLVVGATGGVGQLAVASLLGKGIGVRALLRNPDKARSLFGDQDKLQVVVGDTRNLEELPASIFEGVTHVLCCTGTTAFPSKRWAGDNTPEQTDWVGVRNLVSAAPKTIQRFVLVSSVGVTKCDQLPWSIMNLFGVLKYKKMGEDYLRNSGIPYTIIRPGRLTDGPYTSYDLNTLLQATSGTRRDVILGRGDTLVGEASRIMVAEACIQAMDLGCTCGQTYELNSIQGDGPGNDCDKWAQLFVSAGN